MRTVKLVNEELDLEIDLNLKDNWEEVTLVDYLELADLMAKKDVIGDEVFFLKMLSLLSDAKDDELSQMPVSEFIKLTDVFTVFAQMNVDTTEVDHLTIDGQLFVPKKNMTTLTVEETIFIKQIQKNSQSTSDTILGMLSILLRPGYEKVVGEKTKYIMNKFDAEEVEERKEFFKKNLNVSTALPIIQLFINGTKG